MEHLEEPDYGRCRILFVTDGNGLDDSVESASHRELLRGLAGLGMPCGIISRLLIPGEGEIEPHSWLAAHGWTPQGSADPESPGPNEDKEAVLRGTVQDVSVVLLRGPSLQPHPPDDAERAALLRLVTVALDRQRPQVVIVRSGPCLAEVLALAHSRSICTVAYQPDCAVHDAAPFQKADVVLTPTRLAAEYLREAFGLPCINLPPIIAREKRAGKSRGPGAVLFEGTGRENSLFVFAQIAEELGRRRPRLPIVVLGGTGSVPLPSGGSVKCIPHGPLGPIWSTTSVFLAPLVGWEQAPFTALSALSHGVPVITSNRGAVSELFDGAGLMFSLPEQLTPAVSVPLKQEELNPWVEAILRLDDDQAFASSQRSLALMAGKRWTAEKLVPEYARFLVGLATRKQRQWEARHAPASRNGSTAALQKLAETYPWPEQQPEDAAPGQEQGWLGAGTELMLADVLTPRTQLVVELGAWLGLSSRYIAQLAPGAVVVSVDHWIGSPEHQTQERFQKLLPRLYETFQARSWDYRDRIVPLRMTTLEGLRKVAEFGLHPDFVYVDAEHSFNAVTAELTLARELFPRAILGGDDYDWKGVREGVDTFARQHGLLVKRFGARGWRLLEKWDAPDAAGLPPPGRGQCVVLVPHMNGIEMECEQALRWLEGAGVRVVRRAGCSAIDVARNEMISGVLHEEAESILFIDSDIGFDPQDALRLLARPEPVVGGIYAKKGVRELASVFADGVKEVLFGPEAPGLYPLKYAATGFLRIRAGVLRRMIAELRLPLCNTHWGRGVWPFFQPMIVPHGQDRWHYLGEDWAFSHRLRQMGVTPLADTSIRLWHWGRYGFSWEDAGSSVNRYRSYSYRFQPV